MTRGERITIIQRAARALSERSWVDADLVLDEFGFSTHDPRDYGDLYEYAIAVLRGGEDGNLTEVEAYLCPQGHADQDGAADGAADESPWGAGSFRLFLSHTSAHKERAAALSAVLARVGVAGFVAHETIEPTREWQDQIELALRSCDALAALLTDDFVESKWCDQEVGFVVARNRLVIPIKSPADPHGFIAKYQALAIASSGPHTDYDTADRILKALVRNSLTSAAIAPAVVRRYVRSGSFDSTRVAFEMLQAIPPGAWTQEMIEQVDRAKEENSQVQSANTLGGDSIPELVDELIGPLRHQVAAAADGTTDDDIPF